MHGRKLEERGGALFFWATVVFLGIVVLWIDGDWLGFLDWGGFSFGHSYLALH